MAEIDEIRDGEIKRVPQKEHLIGNGSIIQYVLSEHEFETLGEYKDFTIHFSIFTMCCGICISSFVNWLSIDDRYSSGWLVNLIFFIGSLVGIAYSSCMWVSKYKKCGPIYNRLKEKGRRIVHLSQEEESKN